MNNLSVKEIFKFETIYTVAFIKENNKGSKYIVKDIKTNDIDFIPFAGTFYFKTFEEAKALALKLNVETWHD